MAVYYSPQLSGGAGNLATAIGLWDNFFGPTSKLKKQQLEAGKQELDFGKTEEARRQSAETRAAAMHGPTLATAQSIAEEHANALALSKVDRHTREGSIAALNKAPAALWKPTTAMTPEEFSAWRTLHTENGATDLGGSAKAWNNSVGNATGKVATPQGGIPTGYTSSPEGGMSTTGAILPTLDWSAILGGAGLGTPAASAPPAAAAVSRAPGEVAAPPTVQPPAQPGAQSPVSANGVPDLKQLLPLAFNPFVRGGVDWAIDTQNKIATGQEKGQMLEKGHREIEYGTPEERRGESEFIRNAAQLSHRLDQLKGIVEKHGNYEYFNPEGAALLSSLPLDIADNWTKITNPGAVLREGLVHLGKELQIPMPGSVWSSLGTRNATTLAGVEQTKKVLADYVRQYENMPTTKQPVQGLTPELRRLVGETRFGKPDSEVFRNEESASDSPQAQTDFKTLDDFNKARSSGKVSVSSPVNIAGTAYVFSPQGWVPVSTPNTSTNLPLISAPVSTLTPEQRQGMASMLQAVLPQIVPPQALRPASY